LRPNCFSAGASSARSPTLPGQRTWTARDYGQRGRPGAIQTDFSGGMVRDNPEINKRVAEMTALGRAGVPDDIGPMIAALLSDDNRWVNGQRIEVSGGMSL